MNPPLHFHTGALEGFDVGDHVAVAVLLLAAFREAGGIGRFDADENHVEAGIHHGAGKELVIGEVHGSLGAERKVAVTALPRGQRRKQFIAEGAFVADEVVIDEEDAVAPAGAIEVVEFADDLNSVLDPGFAAEGGGDIAEVAVEGAAAGVLDTDEAIVAQVGQAPERGRRLAEIGELAAAVDAGGRPLFQIRQKARQGQFRLVEDEMIDILEEGVGRGEEGSAGDDFFAGGAAAGDDLGGVFALDEEAAQEDDISPGDLAVAEGLDVDVDEAFGPGLREHGGDGEEAQGREERFAADQGEGVVEGPEALGKGWRDENRIHKREPIAGPGEAKKPTWLNTRRSSTTSAYSLTGLPYRGAALHLVIRHGAAP